VAKLCRAASGLDEHNLNSGHESHFGSWPLVFCFAALANREAVLCVAQATSISYVRSPLSVLHSYHLAEDKAASPWFPGKLGHLIPAKEWLLSLEISSGNGPLVRSLSAAAD
jgi:hypothetical protein